MGFPELGVNGDLDGIMGSGVRQMMGSYDHT